MAFKTKFNSEEFKLQKEQREKEEQAKELLRSQTASFTGHRPDKLNNCYSLKHPTSLLIRDKITPIIIDLITKENVNRFISGGAIGVDQIAFWTVQTIKKDYPQIKNIVAIPFKNQDAVWKNEETKKWYRKMLEVADEIINVEDIDKYKTKEDVPYGSYSRDKMQKRNEYMVDECKHLIAVYDGTKGGTNNCIYYARKKSCIDHIFYRLNPNYNFELDISYMVGY